MFRALMLVLAIATVYVAASELDHYDGRYDDIDVDAILANDRLREQYRECFMDMSPCVTADAKFFRSILAEAIVTKCQRCTEKGVKMFEKMIEWYTTNQPEQWNELMVKYLEEAKQAKVAAA